MLNDGKTIGFGNQQPRISGELVIRGEPHVGSQRSPEDWSWFDLNPCALSYRQSPFVRLLAAGHDGAARESSPAQKASSSISLLWSTIRFAIAGADHRFRVAVPIFCSPFTNPAYD